MGFIGKHSWICLKPLKLAKLLLNATKIVKFLKTFKNWFLSKNSIGFPGQILNVFKNAKHIEFSVECDSNGENTENVHMTGFFKRKVDTFLKKKSWIFVVLLKAANLLLHATEKVKFLKTFKNRVFPKNLIFSEKKTPEIF